MLPILAFIALFCGTGLIFIYQLGYFRKIVFEEKEFPGMHILYAEHRGSYKKM